VLTLALLTGCGNAIAGAPAGPSSRTGLFVSDIHFNPLADATLANELAQVPASQWDSIFTSSTQTAYSPWKRDTNFPLLQSLLASMRQRVPNPDIVFMPGDSLVHDFPDIFNATVTNHSTAAYAAFVNTTEQYLAITMAQTFPNAQIVPALGDWDTSCTSDSFPGAGFLTSFASSWNAAVNRYGGAPDFRATFATGGFYSTSFPIDPRSRLIVLNTEPWSAGYTGGCGPGGANLGNVELGWLAAQLDDARSHGQRAWILGHIPPGIDATTTAQNTAGGASCPTSIVPFYADVYSSQLYALFAKNRDILGFGIFGHEHDDDYRVARDAFGVIFGMKIIPSVDPLHSNNPAYVQFTFDPTAGVISDASAWYITNLPSATTAAPGVWASEYDFDLTYGQTALDSYGVGNAVTQILTQPSAQAAFTRYFPSSNQADDFTTFLPHGCALNNLTVTDYAACYCGH
jgi:sphingomyelin phosphodiesterase acid-like 3